MLIQDLENFFIHGKELNPTQREACVEFLLKVGVVQQWIHREDDANTDTSESDNSE